MYLYIYIYIYTYARITYTFMRAHVFRNFCMELEGAKQAKLGQASALKRAPA